ncbi:hypothetical protein RB195_014581 [Necator americanus]|uniref:Uncharacterized protein n=1 Tax=Necator americanus TaxID=51031 RepID=A0ABR1E0X8_NECAM
MFKTASEVCTGNQERHESRRLALKIACANGHTEPKLELDDSENGFKKLLVESDEDIMETTENDYIFNDALVMPNVHGDNTALASAASEADSGINRLFVECSGVAGKTRNGDMLIKGSIPRM